MSATPPESSLSTLADKVALERAFAPPGSDLRRRACRGTFPRLKQLLTGLPDPMRATAAVIVLLESGGVERCVLVDELIGKQQVVSKSLGGAFPENPLLAGAAILGDGRVGLILDVKNLVQPLAVPLARAA